MIQVMNQNDLLNPKTEPIGSFLKKLGLAPSAFDENVVLITGGASGIGEQIARGLAHLKAKVAIIDKLKDGVSISEDINNQGGQSIFLQADLSNSKNLKEAIQKVSNTYGKIDILINNAANFEIQSVLETSEEDWDYTFNTNVKAPFIACKEVIPGMIDRKNGIIVNLMALEGMAHAAAMSASKVALRSLIFSLAAELPQDSNITVMGFAPGLVSTKQVKKVFPKYCDLINISLEDYIVKLKHNFGYNGLMPAEHCAGSLIASLTNAKEYNGLIADPFLPLEKAGIIKIEKESTKGKVKTNDNLERLKGYITEVTAINKSIEDKIALRTETLKKENAYSFKLLRAFKEKSNELEHSKRLLESNTLKLERSNDDLSQFAHVVSHDLKAPLRAINSLITFIEEDLNEQINEDIQDNFNLIRARIKRMENLINGILEYSKVGQNEESLELTDFNELLDNVLFMLSIPPNFELKVAQNLPSICGNRIQFQQIFQNLLSNAIKYHDKAKGKIEVGFNDYPDEYEFWVKDDGPGIKEQFQEKVFGIFQTLQPRDKIESTGVGLSIIKKIILQHNGNIWVESDGETGSTFKFRLPKSKAAA